MAKVIIAALADFRRNPRPNRTLRALQSDHTVTVLGLGAPEGVDFIPYRKTKRWLWPPSFKRPAIWLFLRKWERYLKAHMDPRVEEDLRTRKPDLIITHEVQLMPLLCRVFPEVPVILDLREFYPDQASNSFRWRLLWRALSTYMTTKYIPKASKLWTVSPGLAEGYKEHFGVECTVVPSYPRAADISPHPTRFGDVRIIHHGNASRTRNIETMIEMARLLGPGYSLDLMLVNHHPEYYRALQAKAAKVQNVHIIPPVPFDAIVPTISEYDIGCFLVPPANFNLKHCLPNKFFEFIQARLAVAVGPSPDMAAIVRDRGLGIVSDTFDPQDLADAIRKASPEAIDRFKQASHVAAQEMNHHTLDAMIRQDVEALL